MLRDRKCNFNKKVGIKKRRCPCCVENQNSRSSYCICPNSDTSSGRFASSFPSQGKPLAAIVIHPIKKTIMQKHSNETHHSPTSLPFGGEGRTDAVSLLRDRECGFNKEVRSRKPSLPSARFRSARLRRTSPAQPLSQPRLPTRRSAFSVRSFPFDETRVRQNLPTIIISLIIPLSAQRNLDFRSLS